MAKPGLYANIHAKRARIKAGSGEKMRKVGAKGAPTAKQFRRAASELLKYYVVDFVLPTRTDISVGQLINLEIPPAVPGEDKEPKFSSGLHLITDLSWNLTGNTCQLNVRCIKDSLPNEIETTEIDYGETM